MLGGLIVVALLVLAVLKVGLQRHVRLAGTNAVFPSEVVATVTPGQRLCQVGRLPDGTRAVEVPLDGDPPQGGLRLTVLSPKLKEIARSTPDTRRLRWARFELPRTMNGTESAVYCFDASAAGHGAAFVGSKALGGLSLDDKAIPGAVSARFLRPGTETTLALVPVVMARIGEVRGMLGGPLRAVLIALAVIAGAALALALLTGRLGRRAGLLCALVAVLNAGAWSLLTPVFQIPDEPSHASYVQDLAVKGYAPRPKDVPGLSPELVDVTAASAVGAINFNGFAKPVWDDEGARLATAPLAAHPSTRNPGSYTNVVEYPPLYYATLVPAYRLTHALGGNTLAAVTPMRMASALYAGITVLAIFALLIELFPRRPELAVPIALACAYQPVLTWISGAINPDGALIALGAVMFWLFARGFRRGLSTGVAAGLGLIMVAAVLVQVRALGFGPGWAVGVALLLWRSTPAGDRGRRLALVVACAAGPFVAYELVNVLAWQRPFLPGGLAAAAGATTSPGPAHPNSGFASFVWQYLLPPVGGMTNFFGVSWTVKDLWVPMWVGKFGWYDYQFPNFVNRAALLFYAAVAAGALWALVPLLRRVRTVQLLTLVYALLGAGIAFAIARVAYPLRASGTTIFEQARYVMPLIGAYALALALAASVLRRRAVLVASLFVGVCFVQFAMALELTVQRYYL